MSINNLNVIFTFTVMLLLTDSGNTLKVLGIFPNFIKSHYEVFRPIMIGLAQKGHEVTVLSHFPNDPPVKRVTDLSLLGTLPPMNDGLDIEYFNTKYKSIKMFFVLMQIANMTCTTTYKSDAVRTLVNSNLKFDVVLTEAFNSDCMLGLVYHFRAPHILVSSHIVMPWIHERFGNTENPAIIPNYFGSYSTKMTFFERLSNFIEINLFKVLYYKYSDSQTDNILRKVFGSEIPSISELKNNVACIFVNTHYSITGVRPQVPAVVDIGGIHLQPVQALDAELNDFVNGADYGVIYVSWGSILKPSSLPDSKREALIKAFSLINQRVLLKWDCESIPGKSENVMIRKWFPQRDVLAHENIRLFMTHGGLLGTTEAVDAGVPMIVTPIYGDQFPNSAALCSKNVAVELPYEDITVESLLEAVHEVLKHKYMKNAKKLSLVFNDRQLSPLETTVWWVEHIARTRGVELRVLGKDMPLYKYYLLDVIGSFVIGITITIFLIVYAIERCLSIPGKKKKE